MSAEQDDLRLTWQALEAWVLDAYRADRQGGPQAAEFLGFSRLEWSRFLKAQQVSEQAYTVADLERDVATIQRLRAAGVCCRRHKAALFLLLRQNLDSGLCRVQNSSHSGLASRSFCWR